MPQTTETVHLKDLWDEKEAAKIGNDQLSLLRYRSNLLGADLRITNFGGGNTSSKFEMPDPFTGKPVRVLAVKGAGGDLGSIQIRASRSFSLNGLSNLKSCIPGRGSKEGWAVSFPLRLL